MIPTTSSTVPTTSSASSSLLSPDRAMTSASKSATQAITVSGAELVVPVVTQDNDQSHSSQASAALDQYHATGQQIAAQTCLDAETIQRMQNELAEDLEKELAAKGKKDTETMGATDQRQQSTPVSSRSIIPECVADAVYDPEREALQEKILRDLERSRKLDEKRNAQQDKKKKSSKTDQVSKRARNSTGSQHSSTVENTPVNAGVSGQAQEEPGASSSIGTDKNTAQQRYLSVGNSQCSIDKLTKMRKRHLDKIRGKGYTKIDAVGQYKMIIPACDQKKTESGKEADGKDKQERIATDTIKSPGTLQQATFLPGRKNLIINGAAKTVGGASSESDTIDSSSNLRSLSNPEDKNKGRLQSQPLKNHDEEKESEPLESVTGENSTDMAMHINDEVYGNAGVDNGLDLLAQAMDQSQMHNTQSSTSIAPNMDTNPVSGPQMCSSSQPDRHHVESSKVNQNVILIPVRKVENNRETQRPLGSASYRPYVCDQCLKTFRSGDYLKLHKASLHNRYMQAGETEKEKRTAQQVPERKRSYWHSSRSGIRSEKLDMGANSVSNQQPCGSSQPGRHNIENSNDNQDKIPITVKRAKYSRKAENQMGDASCYRPYACDQCPCKFKSGGSLKIHKEKVRACELEEEYRTEQKMLESESYLKNEGVIPLIKEEMAKLKKTLGRKETRLKIDGLSLETTIREWARYKHKRINFTHNGRYMRHHIRIYFWSKKLSHLLAPDWPVDETSIHSTKNKKSTETARQKPEAIDSSDAAASDPEDEALARLIEQQLKDSNFSDGVVSKSENEDSAEVIVISDTDDEVQNSSDEKTDDTFAVRKIKNSFTCTQCLKPFISKINLQIHMNGAHAQPLPAIYQLSKNIENPNKQLYAHTSSSVGERKRSYGHDSQSRAQPEELDWTHPKKDKKKNTNNNAQGKIDAGESDPDKTINNEHAADGSNQEIIPDSISLASSSMAASTESVMSGGTDISSLSMESIGSSDKEFIQVDTDAESVASVSDINVAVVEEVKSSEKESEASSVYDSEKSSTSNNKSAHDTGSVKLPDSSADSILNAEGIEKIFERAKAAQPLTDTDSQYRELVCHDHVVAQDQQGLFTNQEREAMARYGKYGVDFNAALRGFKKSEEAASETITGSRSKAELHKKLRSFDKEKDGMQLRRIEGVDSIAVPDKQEFASLIYHLDTAISKSPDENSYVTLYRVQDVKQDAWSGENPKIKAGDIVVDSGYVSASSSIEIIKGIYARSGKQITRHTNINLNEQEIIFIYPGAPGRKSLNLSTETEKYRTQSGDQDIPKNNAERLMGRECRFKVIEKRQDKNATYVILAHVPDTENTQEPKNIYSGEPIVSAELSTERYANWNMLQPVVISNEAFNIGHIFDSNFFHSIQPVIANCLHAPIRGQGYTGGISRPVHGAMHGSRTGIWVIAMLAFRAQLGDSEARRLMEDHPEWLPHLMTAGVMHDSGRKGDGMDTKEWEDISGENCAKQLRSAGCSEELIAICQKAIVNKDGDISKDKSLVDKLVHDADALEVIRVRTSFDMSYLDVFQDMKDQIPDINQKLYQLVSQIRAVIAAQFDLLDDNEIINSHPDYKFKEDKSRNIKETYNVKAKTAFEYSPNILLCQFDWLKQNAPELYEMLALVTEEIEKIIQFWKKDSFLPPLLNEKAEEEEEETFDVAAPAASYKETGPLDFSGFSPPMRAALLEAYGSDEDKIENSSDFHSDSEASDKELAEQPVNNGISQTDDVSSHHSSKYENEDKTGNTSDIYSDPEADDQGIGEDIAHWARNNVLSVHGIWISGDVNINDSYSSESERANQHIQLRPLINYLAHCYRNRERVMDLNPFDLIICSLPMLGLFENVHTLNLNNATLEGHSQSDVTFSNLQKITLQGAVIRDSLTLLSDNPLTIESDDHEVNMVQQSDGVYRTTITSKAGGEKAGQSQNSGDASTDDESGGSGESPYSREGGEDTSANNFEQREPGGATGSGEAGEGRKTSGNTDHSAGSQQQRSEAGSNNAPTGNTSSGKYILKDDTLSLSDKAVKENMQRPENENQSSDSIQNRSQVVKNESPETKKDRKRPDNSPDKARDKAPEEKAVSTERTKSNGKTPGKTKAKEIKLSGERNSELVTANALSGCMNALAGGGEEPASGKFINDIMTTLFNSVAIADIIRIRYKSSTVVEGGDIRLEYPLAANSMSKMFCAYSRLIYWLVINNHIDAQFLLERLSKTVTIRLDGTSFITHTSLLTELCRDVTGIETRHVEAAQRLAQILFYLASHLQKEAQHKLLGLFKKSTYPESIQNSKSVFCINSYNHLFDFISWRSTPLIDARYIVIFAIKQLFGINTSWRLLRILQNPALLTFNNIIKKIGDANTTFKKVAGTYPQSINEDVYTAIRAVQAYPSVIIRDEGTVPVMAAMPVDRMLWGGQVGNPAEAVSGLTALYQGMQTEDGIMHWIKETAMAFDGVKVDDLYRNVQDQAKEIYTAELSGFNYSGLLSVHDDEGCFLAMEEHKAVKLRTLLNLKKNTADHNYCKKLVDNEFGKYRATESYIHDLMISLLQNITENNYDISVNQLRITLLKYLGSTVQYYADGYHKRVENRTCPGDSDCVLVPVRSSNSVGILNYRLIDSDSNEIQLYDNRGRESFLGKYYLSPIGNNAYLPYKTGMRRVLIKNAEGNLCRLSEMQHNWGDPIPVNADGSSVQFMHIMTYEKLTDNKIKLLTIDGESCRHMNYRAIMTEEMQRIVSGGETTEKKIIRLQGLNSFRRTYDCIKDTHSENTLILLNASFEPVKPPVRPILVLVDPAKLPVGQSYTTRQGGADVAGTGNTGNNGHGRSAGTAGAASGGRSHVDGNEMEDRLQELIGQIGGLLNLVPAAGNQDSDKKHTDAATPDGHRAGRRNDSRETGLHGKKDPADNESCGNTGVNQSRFNPEGDPDGSSGTGADKPSSENAERRHADREGTTKKASEPSDQASGYGSSLTGRGSLKITDGQYAGLFPVNTAATQAEEVTATSCQPATSDRLSEQQKKLARLEQQVEAGKALLEKYRLQEQQESSAAAEGHNDSERLNHDNRSMLKRLQVQQEQNKENLSALKQQEIQLKKDQLKDGSILRSKEQKSLVDELKQQLEEAEGKLALLQNQQKKQHALNALEKQKQVRQPDSNAVQAINEKLALSQEKITGLEKEQQILRMKIITENNGQAGRRKQQPADQHHEQLNADIAQLQQQQRELLGQQNALHKQLIQLLNEQAVTKKLNRESDDHKKNYGAEAAQRQVLIEQTKQELARLKTGMGQLVNRKKNKQKALTAHVRKLRIQSIQAEPSATEELLADNQKQLGAWRRKQSAQQKELQWTRHSEKQVQLNNTIQGGDGTGQPLTAEDRQIAQQERTIKNLHRQLQAEKAREQKERQNKPATETEKDLQKNLSAQSEIKNRLDKLKNAEQALKSSQWKQAQAAGSEREKLRKKKDALQAEYEHLLHETGITHDKILRQQAEQNPQVLALRNRIIRIEKDLHTLQASSVSPSCSGAVPGDEKTAQNRSSLNQLRRDGVDARVELGKNKKMLHQLTGGTTSGESENIRRLQEYQAGLRMQHKIVEVKRSKQHKLDKLQEKAAGKNQKKQAVLADRITRLVWRAIQKTIAGQDADISELKAIITASDDPEIKVIVGKVMDKAVSKLVTDSQQRGNTGRVTDWHEQAAVNVIHKIKQDTGLKSTAPVVQHHSANPADRHEMEQRSRRAISERAEQFFKESGSSSSAASTSPQTTGAFVRHNKKYEEKARQAMEKEAAVESKQRKKEEKQQSEKDHTSIKKDSRQLIDEVESQRNDPEELHRVAKHNARQQREMQEQKQAEEAERSRETEERLKKLQTISVQWRSGETLESGQAVQKTTLATTVTPVSVPAAAKTEKHVGDKTAQRINSGKARVIEKEKAEKKAEEKTKGRIILLRGKVVQAGDSRNMVTVHAHTGGSSGGGSSGGGSGTDGPSQSSGAGRTIKHTGNIAGFDTAADSEKDNGTQQGSNIWKRGNVAGFAHGSKNKSVPGGDQSENRQSDSPSTAGNVKESGNLGPGQHLDKTVPDKKPSGSRLSKGSAYEKLEEKWYQERKSADEIKREASELKNMHECKPEKHTQKQQAYQGENAQDKLYLKTGPGQYLDKAQVGGSGKNTRATGGLNKPLPSDSDNKSALYDKSLHDAHQKRWKECQESSKTTTGKVDRELEAQKRRAEEIASKGGRQRTDPDKGAVENSRGAFSGAGAVVQGQKLNQQEKQEQSDVLINSFGSYRYVAAQLARERKLREEGQSDSAQQYVTFHDAYLQCQRQQMDKMLNDALQTAEDEAKEQAEKQQDTARKAKEKEDRADKKDSGVNTDVNTDTDTDEENSAISHKKKKKKKKKRGLLIK